MKTYTDLPHLVRLDEATDGEYTAGKFLTAADLADHADEENAAFKTVLIDARPASPSSPTAPLGHRYGEAGVGKWNLELGDVDPALSLLETATESVLVRMPRFDTPDGAARRPAARRAGAPRRRPSGHHRLRPPAGAVRRRPRSTGGPAGEWASGYDDAESPYTPAWQEAITGVSGRDRRPDRARVRRERRGVPRPLDDRDGRRHQSLVPLRHDLPRVPDPDQPDRLPGRQRRRLGALRRAGEGAAAHRLHPDRQCAGLEPAAAQHDPDRVLVPAHRPVPLRPVRRGHALRHHRQAVSWPASPRPT